MSGPGISHITHPHTEPVSRGGVCCSIHLTLISIAAFTPLREPQLILLSNLLNTEKKCVYIVILMAIGAKLN